MEIKNNILVLLGNENDENGNLSDVAILRAKTTIKFLKENSDYFVLPTGSFGDHFNKTSTPHGRLLSLYLIEQGIPPDMILPHTRTSNTLEDSFGVLKYLNKIESVERVHIITSKFHMPRVKFIFGRVLQRYNLTYQEADDPQEKSQLIQKIVHEDNAIKKIKEEWVDISCFDLNKFPATCYENLGYEIRHYDNISYFAIIGAFFVFSFLLSDNLTQSCLLSYIKHIGGIFLISLLWYLYLRFANTAASARRVLSVIEKLYDVPGISRTQHKTTFLRINLSVKYAISLIFSTMIIFILIRGISY